MSYGWFGGDTFPWVQIISMIAWTAVLTPLAAKLVGLRFGRPPAQSSSLIVTAPRPPGASSSSSATRSSTVGDLGEPRCRQPGEPARRPRPRLGGRDHRPLWRSYRPLRPW